MGIHASNNQSACQEENTGQGATNLNDLLDVTLDTPSNGQVLIFNSATGLWENENNEAPSASTPDLQTAYTPVLLFDQNRTSTFGDVTDNSHTQAAPIPITYDFTEAVNGSVRLLEILSNGDTITIPTSQNKTRNIESSSSTTLSIEGNVITPQAGKNYRLYFEYLNGYVFVYIIDATILVTDITAPTWTVAPATHTVLYNSFVVTATMNEPGHVYAVAVADGATAPSDEEIIAGTGSGGTGEISAGDEIDSGSGVSIVLSGFTQSTDCDVYVIAVDEVGNIMETPTKLDVQTAVNTPLLDLTGFNVTRLYSLQKAEQSTIEYPITITDNTTSHELFFDATGKTELTSAIGTAAVPSANSLQWFIDNELSGTNIYVSKIRCSITGHVLTQRLASAFRLWTSGGGLFSDNGENSIEALGVSSLGTSTWLTELNTGTDFSITVVGKNTTSNNQAGMVTNMTSSAVSYFGVFNDRRTQKRIGLLNANNTLYLADDGAQDNTSNIKRLTITVDATGNMKSYKNAAFKDTEDISANTGWANSQFNIGGFESTILLTGSFQAVIVHDAVLTPTQITNLDTELATFFGF